MSATRNPTLQQCSQGEIVLTPNSCCSLAVAVHSLSRVQLFATPWTEPLSHRANPLLPTLFPDFCVLCVKNPSASAGDTGDSGLIPGWGSSPGGGHGSPLQHSCLENPMDRGAWRATVRGVTKRQSQLSD